MEQKWKKFSDRHDRCRKRDGESPFSTFLDKSCLYTYHMLKDGCQSIIRAMPFNVIVNQKVTLVSVS